MLRLQQGDSCPVCVWLKKFFLPVSSSQQQQQQQRQQQQQQQQIWSLWWWWPGSSHSISILEAACMQPASLPGQLPSVFASVGGVTQLYIQLTPCDVYISYKHMSDHVIWLLLSLCPGWEKQLVYQLYQHTPGRPGWLVLGVEIESHGWEFSLLD